MKTTSALFLFICTGSFFSCEEEKRKTYIPPSERTSNVTPQAQTTGNEAADTSATMLMSNENITVTPVGSSENPYAKLTGLNPEHGKPGHRCDISVGAPLNSPPGNEGTTPSSGQPSISTTPSISAPAVQSPEPVIAQPTTQTAPGMNPPHGQPGHDCDIPVGAPLKK